MFRFSFGYSPEEFAHTLHALAEGQIEAEPLITGTAGSMALPRPSKNSRCPTSTPRFSSNRALAELR